MRPWCTATDVAEATLFNLPSDDRSTEKVWGAVTAVRPEMSPDEAGEWPCAHHMLSSMPVWSLYQYEKTRYGPRHDVRMVISPESSSVVFAGPYCISLQLTLIY